MNELINLDFESVGFEKEFGFQLLKMEDVLSHQPSKRKNPFVPHRINFFNLMLLTEGEMVHEVNFKKYKMTKGDCLFISKGQIHKFDETASFKGYGIIFTEDFLLHHVSLSALSKISFLYHYHLGPSPFKDFGDRDIFITALKRELALDMGDIKADIAASMLAVFLMKAQVQLGSYQNAYQENYKQFLHFQNLVSARYMHSRIAATYAAKLNLTFKQLNKLCHSFTQKTAKEYINDYIILEAKRWLATTSTPINHIAYECGFSEATNFLKFFKRYTQMTPSQFRSRRVY